MNLKILRWGHTAMLFQKKEILKGLVTVSFLETRSLYLALYDIIRFFLEGKIIFYINCSHLQLRRNLRSVA